jgi:hypothetical protein
MTLALKLAHTDTRTPALNHCAKAAGVAVLDVAQQPAALEHRVALPTALVMHGSNAVPKPVLVHASEHQASVVKLLHLAAADAAAGHTPLAGLYVGSHHQLVVHPETLTRESAGSHRAGDATQQHLHHDPAAVALVNRQLAAAASRPTLEPALVPASSRSNLDVGSGTTRRFAYTLVTIPLRARLVRVPLPLYAPATRVPV